MHICCIYIYITSLCINTWPQDTPSLPQLDDTRWHWAPTVQRPAPKSPGRRDVFSARLRGSTWPKSSASGLVGWEKKKRFPSKVSEKPGDDVIFHHFPQYCKVKKCLKDVKSAVSTCGTRYTTHTQVDPVTKPCGPLSSSQSCWSIPVPRYPTVSSIYFAVCLSSRMHECTSPRLFNGFLLSEQIIKWLHAKIWS